MSKRARCLHVRWLRIEAILSWVGAEFFELGPMKPIIRPGLHRFLRRLKVTLFTRGVASSIEFVKYHRQEFLRFVGMDEPDQERMIRGAFGRLWGRRFLREVQKFSGLNPYHVNMVRVALTVLSSLRAFTLPAKVTTESIEPEGPFFSGAAGLEKFVGTFWSSLGVKEGA